MSKKSPAREEFEACKAYGHHWDSQEIGIAATIYEELLLCDRCHTRRTDTVSRRGADRGNTLRRRYKYPDGYVVEGLRPSRKEVRMSVMNRKVKK